MSAKDDYPQLAGQSRFAPMGPNSIPGEAERVLIEVEHLREQLQFVANIVYDWPHHPWIPGVAFGGGPLPRIIAEHRTDPDVPDTMVKL